ncbi:energy-converting hydrogenase A subunit L [Methanococcus voltae]|uniref:energy-converting hydrogenase subunit EhaL family protein n=1 Tax=Methanococcus voltae TaxID=2188 RepID=UPI001AEB02AA|nr:energy-converting hydrogenase subunit EhaL family protein [Methanococcus voltae]MBP2143758.1 energy-converting hydrogenase A subunit L [Methanococcus voltae]
MVTVPYYLLYCVIAFIIGSSFGLSYSYKKYSSPYSEKKLDKLALSIALLGAILFNIYMPLSIAFLSFPLGMRGGYGSKEFYTGILITLLAYFLTLII